MPLLSIALTFACALIEWLPERVAEQLELDQSAIFDGELWRFWSAHLVHFSLRHALVDGCAMSVLGALVETAYGKREFVALIVLMLPLLSVLLLWTQPELLVYRGASGLCMVLVVVSIGSLWKANPGLHGWLASVVACLLLRTLFEALGVAPNVSGLRPDVHVVWQAHIFGALLGAVWLAIPRIRDGLCRLCKIDPSDPGEWRPDSNDSPWREPGGRRKISRRARVLFKRAKFVVSLKALVIVRPAIVTRDLWFAEGVRHDRTIAAPRCACFRVPPK